MWWKCIVRDMKWLFLFQPQNGASTWHRCFGFMWWWWLLAICLECVSYGHYVDQFIFVKLKLEVSMMHRYSWVVRSCFLSNCLREWFLGFCLLFLIILFVNLFVFQCKSEEITGIMNDFNEPGSLAPTGLFLGGTKYMVIQGEPGAVIRGKKVLHLFPFLFWQDAITLFDDWWLMTDEFVRLLL